MYKNEKVRFNGAIPARLYERLNNDSTVYGINKIDIVTVALTEYYKRVDGCAVGESVAVKCQGVVE